MLHTNKGLNAPYGLGTDGAISDFISVAESWAEHVAQIFSDLQYRGFVTNKRKQLILYADGLPTGFTSHLNAIEDFSPNRANDPFRWIPEGIYYDLFDNLNDFIVYGGPVDDNVSNYTNQQFFNALDIDVRSMPQFRTRFLTENGFNQGVVNLFAQYHY